MRVILEIDKAYAGVLTLTAVGTSYLQTLVSTTAVDLSKANHLTINADGKCTHDFQHYGERKANAD